MAHFIFRDPRLADFINGMVFTTSALFANAFAGAVIGLPVWVYKAVEFLWEVHTYLVKEFNVNLADVFLYLIGGTVSAWMLYSFVAKVYRVVVFMYNVRKSTILLFYSKDVPKIVPKGLSKYDFVDPIIKKESAYVNGGYFSIDKAPKGIFRIFKATTGAPPTFIGHGFVTDNKMYTAAHNVESADWKYYVAAPGGDKMLPVQVVQSSYENDFAELGPSSVLSVLGIKSVKVGFPSTKLVTVYDYDGENYLSHTVEVDPLGESDPTILYTRSNTSYGCSGMPIFSNGKIVAYHVGANEAKKRNVHRIPTELLQSEIEKLSKRNQSILKEVTANESWPLDDGDSESVERAKKIKERDEEERRARSRGEHRNGEDAAYVDDRQAYGKGKGGKQQYEKPAHEITNPKHFKGKSWADIDLETLRNQLEQLEKKAKKDEEEEEEMPPIVPTHKVITKSVPAKSTFSLGITKEKADELMNAKARTQAMNAKSAEKAETPVPAVPLKATAPPGAQEVPGLSDESLKSMDDMQLEKFFRQAGRILKERRQSQKASDTSSTKSTEAKNSGSEVKSVLKRSVKQNPDSTKPSENSTTPQKEVKSKESGSNITFKERQQLVKEFQELKKKFLKGTDSQ